MFIVRSKQMAASAAASRSGKVAGAGAARSRWHSRFIRALLQGTSCRKQPVLCESQHHCVDMLVWPGLWSPLSAHLFCRQEVGADQCEVYRHCDGKWRTFPKTVAPTSFPVHRRGSWSWKGARCGPDWSRTHQERWLVGSTFFRL